MPPTGLRERKKSETRERIAATAAQLFRTKGYDAVTVDDVAVAADVSKKTVFNYFPTKEDLVFARADDRETALLAAVCERPPGVTLLESFRELFLSQTAQIDRLRQDTGPGNGSFFDLVNANPVLQRKMHEVNARMVLSLTDALIKEVGADADDPVPAVVASTLIGAQRTLFRRLQQRAATASSAVAIARAHRRDVQRVVDHLEAGLGAYPAHRSSVRLPARR
jgi:AcrR family transcriptional regulator